MKYLLILAAALALGVPAALAAEGHPGADVCLADGTTTVHVNGNAHAVANYLRHHPGSTLGECPPTEPPPPPTEPPATAAASGPAPDQGPNNVWLCTPLNGPQPYLDTTLRAATDIANGSRYANEILGSSDGQPNGTKTGVFRCDVPAGAKRIPGVLADLNGWLYSTVDWPNGDGATLVFPAYTAS